MKGVEHAIGHHEGIVDVTTGGSADGAPHRDQLRTLARDIILVAQGIFVPKTVSITARVDSRDIGDIVAVAAAVETRQ